MTLDMAVSRAVAQSQLLEAALHSDAPWFMVIGGVRVLATRVIHEHGVTFNACFSGVPTGSVNAALYEGDVCRSVRPFAVPDEGDFCLGWDLTLEETVRA